MTIPRRTERPLHWVGSAKRDLLGFPDDVVDEFGYALGAVQMGGQAKSDVDLIHERLKAARNDYEVRYGKEN